MELLQIILMAFAMSIDAFSVALGVGCGGAPRLSGLKMSLSFGLFQFIMPLIGAALATWLSGYFGGINYIAAVILFFIAFKMFREACTKKDVDCSSDPTKGFGLLYLSLATSMDALGIGVPAALMQTGTLIIAGIIGLVCAVMSWLGFILGGKVTRVFSKAEYIGALVLFGIGIKMLFV